MKLSSFLQTAGAQLSEGTAAPAQGAVREASLQFPVTLVDEDDLYNWEVSILGSLNTYYEGGYFTALQVRHGLPLLPAGLHQDVAGTPTFTRHEGYVLISTTPSTTPIHRLTSPSTPAPMDHPEQEVSLRQENPTQNVTSRLMENNTFSLANLNAFEWKETKTRPGSTQT